MSLRGKRGQKKERFFRNFILLLLFIFLVFNIFKIPVFHSAGFAISKYFFIGRDVVFSPITNLVDHLRSKDDLIEENKKLKEKLSGLEIRLLTSEILEDEYHKILSFTEDGIERNLAKVILRPPYTPFDILNLSGDFRDVSVGKKVFYKNVVLGEITNRTNDIAEVKLYSTPGNVSVGMLESGHLVDVIGRGSGRYEITLSKDIEIEEGDPVVLPDGQIVIFGVVNEISKSDDELFNRVLFNLPVEFSELKYVEIGS